METLTWTIETVVGSHLIAADLCGRDKPIPIYVDGNKIGEAEQQKGLIQLTEYNFSVDGEPVLFLNYWTNKDLVFRGYFVKKKKEYTPEEPFSAGIKVLLMILSFLLPPVLAGFAVVPILYGIYGVFFTYKNLSSPFYTRRQALLRVIGTTLLFTFMSFAFMAAMVYWKTKVI